MFIFNDLSQEGAFDDNVGVHFRRRPTSAKALPRSANAAPAKKPFVPQGCAASRMSCTILSFKF